MFSVNSGTIAVPIIIAGIAGLTLSITAIERIYALSKDAFKSFTTKPSHFIIRNIYREIINDTFAISIIFVIVEIIGFISYAYDSVFAAIIALVLLIEDSILVLHIFYKAKSFYSDPPSEVLKIGKNDQYEDTQSLPDYYRELLQKIAPG